MNSEYEYIKRNVELIGKRVERAALKSSRKVEDIKVVAVTKTVEPEKIICAIDSGLCNLGENRVQELCKKYDIINRDCKWDLIGHLQTNKVKYIIDKVNMIHSVDRLELAMEIQKRAEKIPRVINVLVQVNVAEEDSKSGIKVQEVPEFLRDISVYPNLKVSGLMTIAPYAENPEDVRWVFRELNKIFIDIRKENIDNIDMKYLSMGMSNDFEVAIEEGANIVRIGTAIFGSRQYN
jgi:pyridoxal phosphate enzyme (YggS family)